MIRSEAALWSGFAAGFFPQLFDRGIAGRGYGGGSLSDLGSQCAHTSRHLLHSRGDRRIGASELGEVGQDRFETVERVADLEAVVARPDRRCNALGHRTVAVEGSHLEVVGDNHR